MTNAEVASKTIISTQNELKYYDQLHAEKYRDINQSFDQHCEVLATNLASNKRHKSKILDSLLTQRFLPAGRVQAAMGATEREVSAFNCSVSQRIDDSMDSIMAAVSNAAKILRLGTGIGYNFSNLRPKGALISKLKTESSGPLSFMSIFDVMASTIASSGHRRGAQMGIINCFSGDTKVHTLLHGKVAIRELIGKQPILYCVDNGAIKVEKAISVHKTGEKRVITVVLDNDAEITCTPDHLFMLSNGKYIEAIKLKKYDSLTAIKKRFQNNYLHTGCTGNRNSKPEHIMVYESFYGEIPEGYQIHHKDFNNVNNDPNNLECLTINEHMKIHGNNIFEKHRDRIASSRKGKTLEQWLGSERASIIRENMKKAKQKQALEKDVWNENLNGENYTSHYKNGFSNQYPKNSDPTYLDKFFNEEIDNHKVLRIEDRGEITDVYDISMPNIHNFFVEEICVHNCDHPDVEAFIDAKMEKNKFRQFNFSVGISDKFMQAVQNNGLWDLVFDNKVYKTISAQYLWEKIIKNAYYSAEPGIIFIDRLNDKNNLYYCEHMEATNPCAEQPLPPYGLCLLGSFNLLGYLASGKDGYWFNYQKFEDDINTFVEAYDNIFEKSVYAIPEHKQEALNKRRMGLGLTGIANCIELLLGSKSYGNRAFCNVLDRIAKTLTECAYDTSIELAIERGSFPLYEDKYLQSKFIETLPDYLQNKIAKHSIRNSHLISYAPCGTISQCAGNVSSGVEPIFYHSVSRDVHMKEGKINISLNDYNFRNYGFKGKTLEECTVKDHLNVVEILQKYTDSSISKTVNVAPNCSYEEYEKVYLDAYKLGIKGTTVYRPSELRGAVITKAVEQAFSSCASGVCSM